MSDQPIRVMIPEPLPSGLSREEFKERWARVADIAMGLPCWQHVQGHAHHHLIDLDATGLRGHPGAERMAPDTYAGVTTTDFATREELSAFLDDPSYKSLVTAYEDVIGESPRSRLLGGQYMIGVPQLMFEKGGPDALKMFAFLPRVSRLSRAQYLTAWHAFAEANFCSNEAVVGELLAYYQVHALDDEIARDGFDGTILLRFCEPAAFPRWVQACSTMAASPEFFIREKSLYLLVTEERLYDRERPPTQPL
jgi:hypothetical protein